MEGSRGRDRGRVIKQRVPKYLITDQHLQLNTQQMSGKEKKTETEGERERGDREKKGSREKRERGYFISSQI